MAIIIEFISGKHAADGYIYEPVQRNTSTFRAIKLIIRTCALEFYMSVYIRSIFVFVIVHVCISPNGGSIKNNIGDTNYCIFNDVN